MEARIKEDCVSFLQRSYSLKLPDDWLVQCIAFFLENCPTPNASIAYYRDLVFKQLTDYDLILINTESLPKKVFQTENGFIEGTYLLQVNLCIDANQSYFSYLQRLKDEVNENALVDADNVPTSATQFEQRKDTSRKNRLFTLFLTDGTNFLKAIEYTPIGALTDDILPGTKVELRGRIRYQNQVLHLGPDNIRLLGGTVEGVSCKEHLIATIEKELAEKSGSGRGSAVDREITRNFDTSHNNSKFKREPLGVNGSNQPSSSSSNYCKKEAPTQQPPTNSVKSEAISQKWAQNYGSQVSGGSTSQTRFVTSNAASSFLNQNNYGNYGMTTATAGGGGGGGDDDDDNDDEILLINCDLNSLEKNTKCKPVSASSSSSSSFVKTLNQDNTTGAALQCKMKRPPSMDVVSLASGAHTHSTSGAQAVKNEQQKKQKCDQIDKYLDEFKPPPSSSSSSRHAYDSSAMLAASNRSSSSSSSGFRGNTMNEKNNNNNNNDDDEDDYEVDFMSTNQLSKFDRRAAIGAAAQASSNKANKQMPLAAPASAPLLQPPPPPPPQQSRSAVGSKLAMNLSDLVSASFVTNCCQLHRPAAAVAAQAEANASQLDSSSSSSSSSGNNNNVSGGISQLSTCEHTVRAYFKTLTSPLTQVKLNWMQECIVTDGVVDAHAYLSNEPLVELLEITCRQARELFKKIKSSSVVNKEEDENHQYFDRCRKNCEYKLKKMHCTMRLRYDLERRKFAVSKLENIELVRD